MILLIGATGPTGRELLKQGLKLGHEVTALVRDPAKLPAQPGLRTVAGNILDVAEFTLRQVTNHQFLGKTPLQTYCVFAWSRSRGGLRRQRSASFGSSRRCRAITSISSGAK